jgi:protein-disulfide isomerase-like protein with CxxC motif
MKHHARPQRIAIGPSVPLVTGAKGTSNNRRITRREREEGKKMALTTADRKVCSQLGLDPAAFAQHKTAQARQTAGATEANVDAAIMKQLGLETDAKEQQFLGDLDSVCRAAMKSDDPEIRASASRVLMAMADALPDRQ